MEEVPLFKLLCCDRIISPENFLDLKVCKMISSKILLTVPLAQKKLTGLHMSVYDVATQSHEGYGMCSH